MHHNNRSRMLSNRIGGIAGIDVESDRIDVGKNRIGTSGSNRVRRAHGRESNSKYLVTRTDAKASETERQAGRA